MSLGDSLRIGKRENPVFDWIDCPPESFQLPEDDSNEIFEDELDDPSTNNSSSDLPDSLDQSLTKRGLLLKTLRLG